MLCRIQSKALIINALQIEHLHTINKNPNVKSTNKRSTNNHLLMTLFKEQKYSKYMIQM